MTEKKPPLADKGKLIYDFSGLGQGRDILTIKDDGRPPNPEFAHVLAVMNGEAEILTNPMKDTPQSADPELKSKSIEPGFKFKKPEPQK